MGLHPQVDRGHRLAFNVVVDATGSKVYGTGEWQRRQHRVQRRRTWRTLPLALDTHTQEVIAAALTAATVHDAEVFPALLAPMPADEPIASIAAESAYETQVCHPIRLDWQAEALIPPRANAVAWPPRVDG
ncbi:MAG: transposase [Candidatus Competibacteraceae bacterium]|nr:transposase [Candidatus Competibacteraceae bacterium]